MTAADVLARFPWLAELPDELLDRLDWAEFHLPSGAVADVVRELETATGQLVMTYRRDRRREPGTVGLCELIEAATLSPADTAALVRLERTVEDACVVLYRNPLRLR